MQIARRERRAQLPRGSVDARFFHDIGNHTEQRVLEKLDCCCSDIEPWMIDMIKQQPCGPCDACLKAEAPLLGPTGQLPQDDGLFFLDIWHCSIPALFTGNRTRIAVKHAGESKYFKSLTIKRKSDAPAAIELILAFFNSLGKKITWFHTDCAPELKSGGVTPLAQKHHGCLLCPDAICTSVSNEASPEALCRL